MNLEDYLKLLHDLNKENERSARFGKSNYQHDQNHEQVDDPDSDPCAANDS